MYWQALTETQLQNRELNKRIEDQDIEMKKLKANQRERKTMQPAPSDKLASQRMAIMKASHVFVLTMHIWPQSELLQACNPKYLPQSPVLGPGRYASTATEEQAYVAEVFQIFSKVLWKCLGTKGSAWAQDEVC